MIVFTLIITRWKWVLLCMSQVPNTDMRQALKKPTTRETERAPDGGKTGLIKTQRSKSSIRRLHWRGVQKPELKRLKREKLMSNPFTTMIQHRCSGTPTSYMPDWEKTEVCDTSWLLGHQRPLEEKSQTPTNRKPAQQVPNRLLQDLLSLYHFQTLCLIPILGYLVIPGHSYVEYPFLCYL